MSLFGRPGGSSATVQSQQQQQQPSRSRRPNIRSGSPGPSSGAMPGGRDGGGGVGGGGLFASSTAAGKAPLPPHREPELYHHQHQRLQQQQQPTPAPDLTQDQKEEITDAFNLFDLNQDRKIDYHELKVAMKALGFDVPKPELLETLRRHGVLISGQPPTASVPPANLYITYESFVEIMTHKIAERDPLEEITRAFELFAGVGGSGGGGSGSGGREAKIGIEDLRRVAKELGESLEEEELQAMIDEFDIDGDGKISRDEFISICRGD